MFSINVFLFNLILVEMKYHTRFTVSSVLNHHYQKVLRAATSELLRADFHINRRGASAVAKWIIKE